MCCKEFLCFTANLPAGNSWTSLDNRTEISRKEKKKAIPHIFDEGGLLSKADTLAAYLQEHFVFAAIELLGDLLLRLRPLFPQHDLCESRSHAV